jgi:hypothetical protein
MLWRFWELFVEGTSVGDGTMIIELERKDGKFTGPVVDDVENNTTAKLSRLEEKEKHVTVYFSSNFGHEVYVFMERKGDGVVGSIIDMFDLTSKRIEKAKND